MTLLVHNHLEELFQLLITLARFLFNVLFAASDSKAMTLHKVYSLHISFCKTF